MKEYKAPPTPTPPVLADLASELSEYDAQEPIPATTATATHTSTEEFGGGAKEFLEFLEQDLPKPDVHH